MFNFNLDFSNWLTYVYLQLIGLVVVGMTLSYMNYQPQSTLVWNDVQQTLDTYVTIVTPLNNTPLENVQMFFQQYDKKQLISVDTEKLVYKINNMTFTIYSKNPQQVLNFINTHKPSEIEIDKENNKVWVLFVKQ